MDPFLTILQQHPTIAAPQLLGATLLVDDHETVITEVEAYGGVGEDPASHAFRRRTARNSVMFERPGLLYVYFTYGMHWCANVVAHESDVAGAILIRGTRSVVGPARICSTFGISGADNGADLLNAASRIQLREGSGLGPISTSSRIGISVGRELPWRFFVAGEPVSRPAKRVMNTAG